MLLTTLALLEASSYFFCVGPCYFHCFQAVRLCTILIMLKVLHLCGLCEILDSPPQKKMLFNIYDICTWQFSGGNSRYYVHAPDVGLVSMLMGDSNEHYFYHFDAIGWALHSCIYVVNFLKLLMLWRIQGLGAPLCVPLRVLILSFGHTIFSKCRCVRSQHPPHRVFVSSPGKSCIRHCVYTENTILHLNQ